MSHQTPERECAVCDAAQVDIVGTLDRNGAPLRNVLCQTCGTVWVDPRPQDDSIRTFYADDYRRAYKGAVQPKKKHCYRELKRANARLERLRSVYQQGDRVLDIGSGAGFFPWVLAGSSVDYKGIEPNAGYAAFAREKLGLEHVQQGFLEDLTESDCYDIVTIHHVFEHLPDPVDALGRIRSLLKPGGKLIIEVPNVMADYHAPNRVFHLAHLYWYNAKSLQALLARQGFACTDLKLTPKTHHLNAIFTKTELSALPDWRTEYAGAYEEVRRFFDSRTKLRHYASARPYQRFFEKLFGYATEYRQVRKLSDGLEVVHAMQRERL